MNRLREEMLQYDSVQLAGVVFQACLIDRSSISPLRINSLRAVGNSVPHTASGDFGTTLPLVVLMNFRRTFVTRPTHRAACGRIAATPRGVLIDTDPSVTGGEATAFGLR